MSARRSSGEKPRFAESAISRLSSSTTRAPRDAERSPPRVASVTTPKVPTKASAATANVKFRPLGARLAGQYSPRDRVGILFKNPSFELTQFGAGLETQVSLQPLGAGSVGIEGVRLSAGPIEREHEPCSRSLAIRLLAYKPFQVGDQRFVAAETQSRVDQPFLLTVDSKLVEAGDLILGPVLVCVLLERVSRQNCVAVWSRVSARSS